MKNKYHVFSCAKRMLMFVRDATYMVYLCKIILKYEVINLLGVVDPSGTKWSGNFYVRGFLSSKFAELLKGGYCCLYAVCVFMFRVFWVQHLTNYRRELLLCIWSLFFLSKKKTRRVSLFVSCFSRLEWWKWKSAVHSVLIFLNEFFIHAP